MNEFVRNKKKRKKLVFIIITTTPLFGLIAGIPFVNFKLHELSNFMPGIAFITLITFMSWLTNVTLLLLGKRITFLRKIISRAVFSTLFIATTGFLLLHLIDTFFSNPTPVSDTERIIVDSTTPYYGSAAGESSPITKSLSNQNIESNYIIGIAVEPNPFRTYFPQFIHSITINLIILMICDFLLITLYKQKVENENQFLRQSNLEARNNQLKTQLHPHFLFNSLNTLRLLMKKDTQYAEHYLLQLSDILRFSTSTTYDSLVSLKDELHFCLTYLEMQKTRFRDMLSYSVVNKNLYADDGRLPVYALLTLVENAIKHNSLSNEIPLHISIDYEQKSNAITVKNTLRPKTYTEASTGIGLQNLAERYLLLANEKITINNTNDEFAVTIKIL